MVDKSVIFLDRISKIIGRLEEDEIGWESILEAFGFEYLLDGNNRLIRSQHFGDEDYPWWIAKVLKDAYKDNPDETRQMIQHILLNDLIHKDDIAVLEDALDNYPGLNNFLNEGLNLSESSTDKNSTKTSVKVFISYNTKDKLVGAKIKDILASFGIVCFMAHDDIENSEEWKKRILKELHEADIFIPILNDNFKNSEWCSQEAGIACYRNILIIPISLDERGKKSVIPYGFMNHLQGKPKKLQNIPKEYLINPIANKFPNLNIFNNLIEALRKANSFRNAEKIMLNLVPYFDKLSYDEINKVVDISIDNRQIWDAGDCKVEYLPKFIEINKDKIDKNKLKRLSKLIGYEMIGGSNMDKWADYGISAVKYNSKGIHIEQVKIHVDNGDSIGAANVWTREKVISELENKYSFVTIVMNSKGNWDKGKNVEIIKVNGTKYIRTDKNNTASDNLENLPKF